jgi:hypothetical protein
MPIVLFGVGKLRIPVGGLWNLPRIVSVGEDSYE